MYSRGVTLPPQDLTAFLCFYCERLAENPLDSASDFTSAADVFRLFYTRYQELLTRGCDFFIIPGIAQ